jgi:hypothetical protein
LQRESPAKVFVRQQWHCFRLIGYIRHIERPQLHRQTATFHFQISFIERPLFEEQPCPVRSIALQSGDLARAKNTLGQFHRVQSSRVQLNIDRPDRTPIAQRARDSRSRCARLKDNSDGPLPAANSGFPN